MFAVANRIAESAEVWEYSVAIVALTYPSEDVKQIPSDLLRGTNKFLAGVSTGDTRAYTYLLHRLKACPRERIVLIGYSQGAMVMHRVQFGRTVLPAAVAGRIDASVLIADGDRMPNDNVTLRGSAPAAGMGISRVVAAVATPPPNRIPVKSKGRVISWCERGDVVCDITVPRTCVASAVGGAVGAALLAACIKALSAGGELHGTTYRTHPVLSNQMADASFALLRLPLRSVTKKLSAATTGTAYQANLATYGGTKPYRWSATGLPAGLALAAKTGWIGGTALQSGTFTFTTTVRDAAGQVAKQTYALQVRVPLPRKTQLGFTAVALRPATVTVPYELRLPSDAWIVGSNSVERIASWSVIGGALPAGLTMTATYFTGDPTPQFAIAGKPTRAASGTVTLRADNGSSASRDLSLPWVVSPLPTTTHYQLEPNPDAAWAYSFTVSYPVGKPATIVRIANRSGQRLTLPAASRLSSTCLENALAVQSATRDGRFVLISCTDRQTWNQLYRLDVGSPTPVRVDIPASGFTSPPLSWWDSPSPEGAGLSADGRYIAFFSHVALNADAAAETRVDGHLYVRDVTGGKTGFLAAPRNFGLNAAMRSGVLSQDGQFVDIEATDCSGTSGGFCSNGLLAIQRSPFADTAQDVCNPYCAHRTERSTDGLTGSGGASDDGLRIAVHVDAVTDASGVTTKHSEVYDGRTRSVVYSDPAEVDPNSRLPLLTLSGDGTQVFSSIPIGPFVCRLERRALAPDLTLGVPVQLDPLNALPRTGCAVVVWSSTDGGRVLIGSSSTNLMTTAPPIDYPDSPFAYYWTTI